MTCSSLFVQTAFYTRQIVEQASLDEKPTLLKSRPQPKYNRKKSLLPLFSTCSYPKLTFSSGNRVAGLESRLAHIEEQLQLVLNNAKQAHQPRRQSSVVPPTDSSPNNQFDLNDSSDQTMVSSDSESYHNGFTMDEQLQPWKFDPIQPIIYQGPEPPGLQLPPLSEILPVIDHYFNSYNTITPLFHKQTFMSMLNNWYSRPSTRDRVIWSAVQIVMASGYRSPQLASFGGLTTQIKKADECLRNAQSTVSELVTREEDLLGVQILLGIVNLFQNSRDPKPASVIIGTAVRLAHRLRLHSNQAAELYSAAEAEQRSRVFWIAYMLDKVCSQLITNYMAGNSPITGYLIKSTNSILSIRRRHRHRPSDSDTLGRRRSHLDAGRPNSFQLLSKTCRARPHRRKNL